MSELILEVTEVKCEIYKRNPPLLYIKAKGKVNSGGWSDPELRFSEIKNGTAYFDFYAKPPEGPATQQIEEILCSGTFDVLEPDIRRVVIRSNGNPVECDLRKTKGSNKNMDGIVPTPCRVINGHTQGIDLQGAINDALSQVSPDNRSRRYEIVDHYFQTGGITGPITFVTLLMC